MVKSRRVGLLIMGLTIPSILLYLYGIIHYSQLVLDFTATTAVVGVLGLLTWIGYTMFTEPPSPKIISPDELDDLRPETIQASSQRNERHLNIGESKFSSIVDVEIGEGTLVRDHVSLYKCKIGKNCKISSFVYIEEQVVIGDGCKIKPHVFIPTGVKIEDNVFIGPNVTFTNDKYPKVSEDWKLLETLVCKGASIGAHSVILPGVKIGENAVVGAGSVVTKDIPESTIVYGNPARVLANFVVKK